MLHIDFLNLQGHFLRPEMSVANGFLPFLDFLGERCTWNGNAFPYPGASALEAFPYPGGGGGEGGFGSAPHPALLPLSHSLPPPTLTPVEGTAQHPC